MEVSCCLPYALRFIELQKVQSDTSLNIDIYHKIHLATLLITVALPILQTVSLPDNLSQQPVVFNRQDSLKPQRRCNFCVMIFDPGMLGVTLKFNTTLAVSAA